MFSSVISTERFFFSDVFERTEERYNLPATAPKTRNTVSRKAITDNAKMVKNPANSMLFVFSSKAIRGPGICDVAKVYQAAAMTAVTQHSFRDDLFTHEIAKRAVARAALALNVPVMTSEGWNVLADALCQYVSRIGQTMSHSVEASGRSSAHCNVWDAIQAIELCTSPAVARVHLDGSADETTRNGSSSSTNPQSWKSLASFMFGPKWIQSSSSSRSRSSSESGKVGPSASFSTGGWNAPFPEEVDRFPVASQPDRIANPHTLSDEAWKSLHGSGKSEQAGSFVHEHGNEIPTELWGLLSNGKRKDKKKDNESSQKRQREEEGEGSLRKRVKLSETNDIDAQARELAASFNTAVDSEEETTLPAFYPPFPRQTSQAAKLILDDTNMTVESAVEGGTTTAEVRSALLQLDDQVDEVAATRTLGGGHWGTTMKALKVPPGAPADAASTPAIVPLGRASVSRVSRILEGSMDASSVP